MLLTAQICFKDGADRVPLPQYLVQMSPIYQISRNARACVEALLENALPEK